MAYAEFPHGHYLEYDEHQIIFLVKKLESDYAEILEKARKAESDASTAVSKVDAYSTNVGSLIEQKVNSSVSSSTAALKNDFTNLNNKFNSLQSDFTTLRSDVTRETKGARDYVDTVANKLEHDVSVQVQSSKDYTAQLSTQLKSDVASEIREARNNTEKLADNIKKDNERMFTEHRIEFNEYKKVLDAKSKELSEAFEGYKSEVEERNADIRKEVRDQLAKIKQDVADKLKSLDGLTATRMTELSEQIVLAMNIVEKDSKAYTAVEVTKNLTMVENLVDNYMQNITTVVEEIKNSQIYNNVGWLWNNMCSIGGFSAIEIFEYGDFNVDMWNASEITCKEWFTSGKQKLGYNTGRMFDTLSGRFLEVGSVMHELINLLNAQGIIRNGFATLSIKSKRRKWNDNR